MDDLWIVTKYIYSSTRLKYKFEVLYTSTFLSECLKIMKKMLNCENVL